MNQNNRKKRSDIKALELIFKYGTSPQFFSKNRKFIFLIRCLHVLITLFILTVYCTNIYLLIELNSTFVILWIVWRLAILLLFFNLVYMAYCKSPKWIQLLQNLKAMERVLDSLEFEDNAFKTAFKDLFIICILFVFLHICRFSVLTDATVFNCYKKATQLFANFIITLIYTYYLYVVKIIRMRYHLIRIKVIDTMSNKPFPHSNLKNIQCFIIAANNFVNDFNDIFGFSMFCVECIGIASTIEILIISVYSTNDNGFLKQIAEYVFAALFFVSIFLTFFRYVSN